MSRACSRALSLLGGSPRIHAGAPTESRSRRQMQSCSKSISQHEQARPLRKERKPSRGRYMKAVQIFDSCHGRYRGLRDWLADSTGEVRSLDWEKPSSGYQWRPDRGRACEYIADFERIGRRSLQRAEWKGRLKLFELYFIG